MRKTFNFVVVITTIIVSLTLLFGYNVNVHAKDVAELTIELIGDENIYLVPDQLIVYKK